MKKAVPVRHRVVKKRPTPIGTTKGFWNERLNEAPHEELVGGFGFCAPPEPDDPMYLETRARKT